MKTILIVNTREKECAVWQYGRNLYEVLKTMDPDELECCYVEPLNEGHLKFLIKGIGYDAIIYNWHPSQGGWLQDAPFDVGRSVKNLCVFHELDFATEKFDAVLYSGHQEFAIISYLGRTNWHRIPLLLAVWEGMKNEERRMKSGGTPVIGVNGYGGAHADMVVKRVVQEFETAVVRLHLPPAHYGDSDGRYARIFAEKCRNVAKDRPGIHFQVEHEWMPQEQLLLWLSQNDLNVYLRPTDVPWHGVSAAMCAALAVKRPIATNRNPSFRHLWDCQPSVCVEDRSLKEILATGTKPLEPIYAANRTAKFVARIEEILGYLGQ